MEDFGLVKMIEKLFEDHQKNLKDGIARAEESFVAFKESLEMRLISE
jgi:hypothetical protein